MLNKQPVRLLSLLFLFVSICATAQEEEEEDAPQPSIVKIEMKDKTIMRGRLMGVTRDTAEFVDNSGTSHRIAMSDIRRIHYNERIKEGKERDWRDHPNPYRYLLTGSADPMEEGDAIVNSAYIFFNTIHYGISDRVSVAGGGDLIFGTVFFANARVNLVKKPDFALTTGLNYYRLPKEFDDEFNLRNIGMLSLAGTVGNDQAHATLGAGYMYFAKGINWSPIVTASGMIRVHDRISLMTENWFLFVGSDLLDELPVIVSGCLRYIASANTYDLGLYGNLNVDKDNVLLGGFFPYIGYSRRLGW